MRATSGVIHSHSDSANAGLACRWTRPRRGAGLVQQRRPLERALASADDQHAPAGEAASDGLARVTPAPGRQSRLQLPWHVAEIPEPDRDDDVLRVDGLARVEHRAKGAARRRGRLELNDARLNGPNRRLLLKPVHVRQV